MISHRLHVSFDSLRYVPSRLIHRYYPIQPILSLGGPFKQRRALTSSSVSLHTSRTGATQGQYPSRPVQGFTRNQIVQEVVKVFVEDVFSTVGYSSTEVPTL